jgi:carbonic anhydrase
VSHAQPHFAKNVFFGCIDDRLVKPHAEYIESVGGAFAPAVAGGGLAFVSEMESLTALKQVAAAYQINHITDAYLESHTDCGAYRLAGAVFTSPTDELLQLYHDLDQAAELVQQALVEAGARPGEVTIHTRVVNPGGELLERPQPAAV